MSRDKLNEAKTRIKLIDPLLTAAGWNLKDLTKVRREVPVDGYDAAPWNGVTDYCLYDARNNVLAVVEAKKASRSPREAEVSGDFMTFGAGGYKRDIKFGAKKRIYPIMIRKTFVDRSVNTYNIPEGFEIINRPKNICLKSKIAEFFRTYKINGRSITEMETRRYKRARLPASDYEKIKQFFNELSQLTNEKIIIKKQR